MGGGLYMGMGDLVTSSNQTMASWWAYKRYADITGQWVSVTASSRVDGVAGTDSGAKRAILVLGSRSGVTGSVTVNLNSIPSYLLNTNSMNVLVERMPAGSGYVSAPTVVSNQPVTVSGGSFAITVNWTNAADAYAITLTPGNSGGRAPTPTWGWGYPWRNHRRFLLSVSLTPGLSLRT